MKILKKYIFHAKDLEKKLEDQLKLIKYYRYHPYYKEAFESEARACNRNRVDMVFEFLNFSQLKLK